MGGIAKSISPRDLYAQMGTAAAPLALDVRRGDAFAQDGRMIVGAIRRDPEAVERWRHDLPHDRTVIVYGAEGASTGESVAAVLAAAGFAAAYLEGGLAAWRAQGLPTRGRTGQPSRRWITRERPKIDRVACPWLIRRFIDPEAEFLYVPTDQVLTAAARSGATPYDVANVEFGHVGDRCSFDAFLRLYGIHDPALDRLALIVRGADTGRPELTPQSAGLLAISRGLSNNFTDDHRMLEHGMVVYDALYAWCRDEVRHGG